MVIKGLTKRTEAQRDDHVKYLAAKPIQELWKLKTLVKSQQQFTYDQYIKATKRKDYKNVEKLERASAELNEMERDVEEAIDRK